MIIIKLAEPLAPKTVDAVLGISSQERLRWYKSGRLRICGKVKMGHGNHTTFVPQFPVNAIAAIASKPGLVDTWRQGDQG